MGCGRGRGRREHHGLHLCSMGTPGAFLDRDPSLDGHPGDGLLVRLELVSSQEESGRTGNLAQGTSGFRGMPATKRSERPILKQTQTVVELRTLNADLEKRVQERTRSLDAANQRLRELDQRKSAFVSMTSHEIRTPLTSMKGFVENMLAGVTGDLRERQVLYLTRVKYNIERLTRTLNDLLDLSRIEAGHVELRLADVSLAEVTAEALDNLRPQAEEKSLVLETTDHPQLAPVRGDRDKILQILTNLVHNAIKFTSPSGRILISLTPLEDSTIQVCVADTGCGHRFRRGRPTCSILFTGATAGRRRRGDQGWDWRLRKVWWSCITDGSGWKARWAAGADFILRSLPLDPGSSLISHPSGLLPVSV